MKTKLLPLFLGLLALAGSVGHAAQLGTGINYQGRLTDGGSPANGTHSFKYRLVSDAAGVTQIGPMLDLPNQTVSGGLFNAPLDFGAGVFNGQERWLEISVKTGGPGAAQDYIKLSPQPLPPGGSSQFARIAGDVLDAAITGPRIAPQAVTSGNLADGAVTAAKLGTGSVGSSQIVDGAITAADIASGQVVKSLNGVRDAVTLVAGSGISLTPTGNGLTLASTGPSTSPWAVNGTSVSYGGGNVGIGTSTPQSRLHVVGDSLTTGRAIVSKNDDLGGELLLHNPGKTGGAADYWKQFNMTGTYGNSFQMWNYPASGGANSRFRINDDGTTILAPSGGNVGIGTLTPAYRLEVFSANSTAIAGTAANGPVGVFGQSTSGWGMYGLSSANNGVVGECHAGGTGVVGKSATGEGVHGETSGSSAAGATVGVHLADGTGVYGESRGQGVGVFGRSATGEAVHGQTSGNSVVGATVGVNLANGNGVFGESRGQGAGVFGRSATGTGVYGESLGGGYAGHFAGKTKVCTLEIYGGCDLAEPFPMKEEQIDKGSVVVIDKEHPGQLKRSTHAYDKRVAGIVSGANGINPGIALKQEGTLDQGENVALTGRVYVKADASNGEIEPGDLLTTSDTPGHAMKVSDHIRSQGAVLGKAMSGLKEGQGLVLVLVTLQ